MGVGGVTKRGGVKEGKTIHSFTDFPCSFALCVNGSGCCKSDKKKEWSLKQPIHSAPSCSIKKMPFPPFIFSSVIPGTIGKDGSEYQGVCVRSYAHKNRACVARSSPRMLGYNMDILWRSEDQHVNHINYTPWWKHRWSSNKEKSAGFAGNLNHIFLKSCSVDPRVAGMHVLILEELVMWHHCAHCFQRPPQLSHAINYIGISNQVETVAIWDSHLCWNGVMLQLTCGLAETQISTVAMTQHR